MRQYKTITLITFIALAAWSCSPKSESASQETVEEATEWKGMDDFHMVMAESFHPYRDSANLAPVKQYAGEMVELANSWVAQELPARVDNQKVKELLNNLKIQTEALADLVEVGDDNAIGSSLNELHDTFHHLQEAWYKKDDK